MDHLRISFPVPEVSCEASRDHSARLTINTVDMVTVGSHEGTASKVEDTADDGADNEHPSSSEAINEGQDTASGHEEDDVLDDRGGKRSVSGLK